VHQTEKGRTAVEDGTLHVREVLAEAFVLMRDLESKLTSMAKDHDRDLAGDGLKLVESGEHKNSSLAHAGLSLANDVHSEYCLGNTFMLD
jgi:hypothetical protein